MQVYNMLKKFGEVYIDSLSNNSINIQKDIFDNLYNCDVVLVLLPDSKLTSKWVMSEISLAKLLNKRIMQIYSSQILSFDLRNLF
ncbi:TIR domain-containing protein [Lacrimispora xylanolytica]|uniref:TIR domain-containing protein n=1 Tax=Lacrimispora xylanolytica TaxID=29375 RepID=UPI003A8417B2